MAKKKDLSGAITRGADLFFSAHDEPQAQQAHEAQEPQITQEALLEAQEGRRTQGRKGLKMARMNMSFTPSNMDYMRVMAGIHGMTVTRFLNYLIEQHAENNAERYQKALEVMRDE